MHAAPLRYIIPSSILSKNSIAHRLTLLRLTYISCLNPGSTWMHQTLKTNRKIATSSTGSPGFIPCKTTTQTTSLINPPPFRDCKGKDKNPTPQIISELFFSQAPNRKNQLKQHPHSENRKPEKTLAAVKNKNQNLKEQTLPVKRDAKVKTKINGLMNTILKYWWKMETSIWKVYTFSEMLVF